MTSRDKCKFDAIGSFFSLASFRVLRTFSRCLSLFAAICFFVDLSDFGPECCFWQIPIFEGLQRRRGDYAYW